MDTGALERLREKILASDNRACFIERETLLRDHAEQTSRPAEEERYLFEFELLLGRLSTPVDPDDRFAGRMAEARWPHPEPFTRIPGGIGSEGHITLPDARKSWRKGSTASRPKSPSAPPGSTRPKRVFSNGTRSAASRRSAASATGTPTRPKPQASRRPQPRCGRSRAVRHTISFRRCNPSGSCSSSPARSAARAISRRGGSTVTCCTFSGGAGPWPGRSNSSLSFSSNSTKSPARRPTTLNRNRFHARRASST